MTEQSEQTNPIAEALRSHPGYRAGDTDCDAAVNVAGVQVLLTRQKEWAYLDFPALAYQATSRLLLDFAANRLRSAGETVSFNGSRATHKVKLQTEMRGSETVRLWLC